MHESIVLLFFRSTCIAHTVAILLQDYWAIYEPPSTSLLHAIHHTILVITISCKGQPTGRPSPASLRADLAPIDSPFECEHNNPDSLDARLFPSVVLAVAPGVMDEESSLSAVNPLTRVREPFIFYFFSCWC